MTHSSLINLVLNLNRQFKEQRYILELDDCPTDTNLLKSKLLFFETLNNL